MNSHKFSSNPEHVAELDIPKYFGEFFGSDKLVHVIESIVANDNEQLSQNILKNSARLSWIADKVDSHAKGRVAFQIMYYAIIAESCAKLADNYIGEGDSKKYVLSFFAKFTAKELKPIVCRAFQKSKSQDFLGVEEVAKLLYKIRCDLAHEGKYFNFFLKESTDSTRVLNSNIGPEIISYITLNDLKKIVLSNSIVAALSSLKNKQLIQSENTAFWLA